MIDMIKTSKMKLQSLALGVYYSGDSDFNENLDQLKNEIQRLEYLRELDAEIREKENIQRSS